MVKAVLNELSKLKITDIKVYEPGSRSIIADAFIIGTAESVIQLEAVRRKVVDLLGEKKLRLKNPLEEWEGGWLLLDFGNIVVHVFLEELRSFYNLDAVLSGGALAA